MFAARGRLVAQAAAPHAMMTVVTGSPCSAFFSAVYASRLAAAAAMLRRSARPSG